jgi:hypothetical protein
MNSLKSTVAICLCLSPIAFGAISTFDFEEASVPSSFSLTGQGGAFSQSITPTNDYAGSQALRLSLTCNGASQWAQTSIVFPTNVQQVSFLIYDQYAANSPVYYYFGLEDSLENPLSTLDGLYWTDGGFGGTKSSSVGIFESSAVTNVRTIGWHKLEATITSDSIEYRMDGNYLGTKSIDSSRRVDRVLFQIANAGNQGTNSLLIDDLSITTIPEPSTLTLGGLAVLGCCFRRKR